MRSNSQHNHGAGIPHLVRLSNTRLVDYLHSNLRVCNSMVWLDPGRPQHALDSYSFPAGCGGCDAAVATQCRLDRQQLFYAIRCDALVLRANARREGMARAAGLPTQDALTGLANMRELLRNIHGAMTRASRYKQQYGLVQIELTNYDWFIKEHGREMGDKALVLLSTRLQLISRDVDTCGRLNENSFALLIEGPCTPSRAAKVSAQIAACAHRPTELLPVGASLKLQITCALMPDLQATELSDDANAQLGWLIHRSEMLDDEPRKVIRTLNF
jgi:diguanylate cyclase (GGDEF)-like protein